MIWFEYEPMCWHLICVGIAWTKQKGGEKMVGGEEEEEQDEALQRRMNRAEMEMEAEEEAY